MIFLCNQLKQTFIYIIDSISSMTTTIAISHDLKNKIRNLGHAGESYEKVIEKMYELTRKQLLINYLYDETDCMSISDAKRRLTRG